MERSVRIAFMLLLFAVVACPSADEEAGERVEIEANELQQAFLADERAARERFAGKDLVIFGEVVRAFRASAGRRWRATSRRPPTSSSGRPSIRFPPTPSTCRSR